MRVEVRFPLRGQDLRKGLLDEAVKHRGDAEGTRLAVALGDVHTLDRARAVPPGFQLRADVRPVVLEVSR